MADYPVITAIPGGDPRWRVYVYTINDTPGVVAANNFLSFFNPANSGVLHIGLLGDVDSYSSGTSGTLASLLTRRITAASGGSLVTASGVNRFLTVWPDPQTVVRTSNPTVTNGPGGVLSAFPPVISTGAGESSSIQAAPAGASFVCLPGEGIVWQTTSGNVNQTWNITYAWAEMNIDSVETV